jgi:hypothetical protein
VELDFTELNYNVYIQSCCTVLKEQKKTIENMAKFKYWGMIVMNINGMHE